MTLCFCRKEKRLYAQFGNQTIEKVQPGLQLAQLDIFIRLMRLMDRARAAHYGRHTGLLETTGFGGIGHGNGAVALGEFQGQRLGQ